MKTQLLAVAIGGATGSVLRFVTSQGVYQWLGRGFPYGTLVVNVLGCGVMGILYVLLTERLNLAPEWRAALIVGLLGGFTTFSAFSMETLALVEEHEYGKAMLNVVLSLLLCLAATWVGVILARRI